MGRGLNPANQQASLGQRFGGVCIDAVATFVITVVTVNPFCALTGTTKTMPLVIAFTLLAQGVQWWLIATRGQSIGKIVLKTRIVTVDGEPVGFYRGVVLRAWPVAVFSFVPVLFENTHPLVRAVGHLCILADALAIFPNRRCLHDYIAGTVVSASPPPPVLVEEWRRPRVSAPSPDPSPPPAALERGDRRTEDWVDALRGRAASDYRTSPLTADELWRVLEDVDASHEARGAAAVALGATLDKAGRERFKKIKEDAPYRLRVVLKAARSEDPAAIAKALEACCD